MAALESAIELSKQLKSRRIIKLNARGINRVIRQSASSARRSAVTGDGEPPLASSTPSLERRLRGISILRRPALQRNEFGINIILPLEWLAGNFKS